jgi:hypothetical protein
VLRLDCGLALFLSFAHFDWTFLSRLTEPEITIVVPTFNGSRWLSSTLTSLQRQEDVNLEVIVIDDGSTDDSAAIAEAHPVAGRVIRQTNHGVAFSRNHGAAIASAPWVAFVDQDDLWHPRRARLLLDTATATGARAVGTSETAFGQVSDRTALATLQDGRENWIARWVGAEDEVEELLTLGLADLGGTGAVEPITIERLMQGPGAITTSFMYDRLAFQSAGGCAPWVRAADDHVLNVCLALTNGDLVRVDTPCLFYRVHSSSTTVISPLVVPYLSMQLAFRWGRALPPEAPDSDYLRHLLSGLPDSRLLLREQLALLFLSASASARRSLMLRWAKGCAKRGLERAMRRR